MEMSYELREWCGKLGFDKEAIFLLAGIEGQYNDMAAVDETISDVTMCEWILEKVNFDSLESLTVKEKFLFGLGVLMSEIANYEW